MKKYVLIAFSLLIGISACQKADHTLTPASGNELEAMAKKTARPFKGDMTYTLDTTLGLPCNCSGSAIAVGDFSGSGNVTHMGLLASHNKTCVTPIIQNGVYVGNHIVIECGSFTAANGDDIEVAIQPYDVYFNNTSATGTMQATFIGGTGRFVNATGGFTGTITIPLNNPNIAYLTGIDGTINY